MNQDSIQSQAAIYRENNLSPDLISELKESQLTTYYTSNIFSKLFFCWTHYAMKKANKEPLKISDFEAIGEKDRVENLLKPVSEKW